MINYPRIFFIVMWVIVFINIFFHNGWQGAIGGILGFDFLGNYSAGILYSEKATLLYDVESQALIQQSLISPTPMDGGVNIFSYPPYVALVFRIITLLPYTWAILIWSIVSMILLVASSWWMWKELIPTELTKYGLSLPQFLILLLSFFPVILGFQIGQNFAITLFLFTGILVFSFREKWLAAGILAGLTIYKPQFALGLIIIWFVWEKYYAILGYLGVAITWISLVIVTKGIQPFFDYLELVPQLMRFPYGVGGPLEVTPYALLATLFPTVELKVIGYLSIVFAIALSVGLVWLAFRSKGSPKLGKPLTLIFGLIFPFLVAPHILIYDLILLIPILLLWSRINYSQELMYIAISIYFACLILPIVTSQLKISLLAVIPIGLLGYLIYEILRNQNWSYITPSHEPKD